MLGLLKQVYEGRNQDSNRGPEDNSSPVADWLILRKVVLASIEYFIGVYGT